MKIIGHFFNLLLVSFVLFLTFSLKAENGQDVHTVASELVNVNLEESDDTFSRTGEIPLNELITRYKIFADNYASYQPDSEEIKQFKRLDGFELVVFFGLWCHDSQREIPRLLKLINQSNTYFKSVKLVALNTNKVLSEKFSSKFEVTKTPTIYVLNNHQVMAKVVESPEGSFAEDFVKQIFGAEKKVLNK